MDTHTHTHKNTPFTDLLMNCWSCFALPKQASNKQARLQCMNGNTDSV